jgi:ABC-type polysaccharide/polyol phosphate transport system ATPase subunit
MGMRLLFTLATSFERDVLLLDEWLGAGDAHFVHKASQRMDQVVGAARVVVLASHSEGLIRSVCNKVMKLHNGEIEFFGSADDYFAMADAG